MTAPARDAELEGFLALLAASRAARTVDAYRRDLDDLTARLGKPLRNASTEELERCLAELRADEVANEAFAAVQYEEFAAAHLKRGRSIFGLFPATPDSKAEYDRWVAAGKPPLDK